MLFCIIIYSRFFKNNFEEITNTSLILLKHRLLVLNFYEAIVHADSTSESLEEREIEVEHESVGRVPTNLHEYVTLFIKA